MPADGARSFAARLRLGVLLVLLAATTLWAWHEIRSRRARTEWQHPLDVAVALVQLGGVDPNTVQALRARLADPLQPVRASNGRSRTAGGSRTA